MLTTSTQRTTEPPTRQRSKARLKKGVSLSLAVSVGLVLAAAIPVLASTREAGPLEIAQRDQSPASPAGGVVLAESLEMWPSSTPEDWVTYGDHLAVIRIASEQKLPASEEELAAGEGYYPRSLTAYVKKVIWSRGGAPALPAEFSFVNGGWTFGEHGEARLQSIGAPLVRVNGDYIVQLTHSDDAGREWTPLGGAATLPFGNGVIGQGDTIYEPTGEVYDLSADAATGSTRAKVWGRQGVEDLVRIVSGARPDPAATEHMSLPTFERWKAVQASKAAGASPSVGRGEER
jgi:hypothetical protein